MFGEKPNSAIALAIQRFKRAAIVTHFGNEDEDHAMQLSGLRSAKRAIDVLDSFGPQARLTLAPLLDDPDWSIRVEAAGYLVKVLPDRALAALKEIHERSPAHARWRASRMLSDHERGELDL